MIFFVPVIDNLHFLFFFPDQPETIDNLDRIILMGTVLGIVE